MSCPHHQAHPLGHEGLWSLMHSFQCLLQWSVKDKIIYRLLGHKINISFWQVVCVETQHWRCGCLTHINISGRNLPTLLSSHGLWYCRGEFVWRSKPFSIIGHFLFCSSPLCLIEQCYLGMQKVLASLCNLKVQKRDLLTCKSAWWSLVT